MTEGYLIFTLCLEASTESKLATLNEKLSTLEHQQELLEAKVVIASSNLGLS